MHGSHLPSYLHGLEEKACIYYLQRVLNSLIDEVKFIFTFMLHYPPIQMIWLKSGTLYFLIVQTVTETMFYICFSFFPCFRVLIKLSFGVLKVSPLV